MNTWSTTCHNKPRKLHGFGVMHRKLHEFGIMHVSVPVYCEPKLQEPRQHPPPYNNIGYHISFAPLLRQRWLMVLPGCLPPRKINISKGLAGRFLFFMFVFNVFLRVVLFVCFVFICCCSIVNAKA